MISIKRVYFCDLEYTGIFIDFENKLTVFLRIRVIMKTKIKTFTLFNLSFFIIK